MNTFGSFSSLYQDMLNKNQSFIEKETRKKLNPGNVICAKLTLEFFDKSINSGRTG